MSDVIFEQKEPILFNQVQIFLLWNTRGMVIKVQDARKVQELLQQGFMRLNRQELKQFKPGDYHPMYDKGEVQGMSQGTQYLAQKGRTQPDTLPIIEL